MDFSFTIDGTEFVIPRVINLRLFERALSWDITDYKNLKPFVSTVTTCPLSELDKLDKETFEIVLGICISRIDVNETEIRLNQGQYKLKPFEELSFGDFMDIDVILTSGGIQKNASVLASKLYGMPLRTAEELDINSVWGTLLQCAKWREGVYKEYNEFFGIPEDMPEDVVVDRTPEETQFMWYEAVYLLANEQFLNIEQVVLRPYKEALNFLTYKKHLAERAKLEQLKRKNELQRRT